MPNEIAPQGAVFVCGACGKRSRDKYGTAAIDKMWDSSCMLHAVLCDEASLVFDPESGRVVKAEPWKQEANPG